jgi:23S rRNA (adenine2503-C2)-methyltransferase
MRVTNIVFMGMGEPLDNVDAVVDAISILTDPYGLALGLRRISVSTAGHLDGIEALLARVPGVRLALSVHSVDEAKRSKIMPINRRWPLALVLERLRRHLGPSQAPVMLQYTMIKGVNDALADAERLAELTAGLNAKINLIPLNEVGPSRLSAPPPETIQAFRDVLHARGLRVMVRYSKGQDIAAACGQLVVAAAPSSAVAP